MTDEGNIEPCLGIQIGHEPGFMRMSQPNLINRIINAVPRINKSNPKPIPMSPTLVMNKDLNGKEKQETWNHRSLIGMMNTQ